uniref:SAP domain-containing protein n=1 Tax=Photinus pyralis TaxID=7054 RepID=A0A1Y1LUM2_PHOPY
MSSNVEKRKLSELGVVDLRSELEKRDLDKTGLKQVLVERLQKALQDAGEDPAVFEFQVEKKLTKRPSTTSADSEVAKDKTEENGPDNVKVNNTKDQEKEETKEKKENSPKKEGEKKMPDSNEEAPAESDNLIQLTLDEQEENFQDEEEVDSTGKTDTESDKPRKEDAKNTSTNADTTKEHEDIAEKTEAKTHEGNSSSAGVRLVFPICNNHLSGGLKSVTHQKRCCYFKTA